MYQFCKKLLILCLLILLTVLVQIALPAPASAELDGNAQEEELTAQADPGNVIGQAFANMINRTQGDETLLEEYPLDPHELEEYGDSIRVRFMPGSTKDEPSYMVYREDLYLIPQEEAAAYTVVRSEDGLTAEISPAPPEGALEGKSGLVLLGEDIGHDAVLLFDGAPVRSGTGMTFALLPAEKAALNRIFSDGQFTASITAGARQPSARTPSLKKSPQLKALPNIPYFEDIDETNVTGQIWYNSNDFRLNVSFKVDPGKMDFGLNIDIAAKAYFDLTTSGAMLQKTIFSKDIDLYSEELFDVNLKYEVRAQFNDVPVHVKGHIDNSVTYVFGVIGATLQNYEGPVILETAELVNPERDKNKDAHFRIGTQLSTAVEFLKLDINVVFYEFTIGPVFSVSFDLSADTDFTLRLNKDIPVSPDRTDECIHACAMPGHAGCYTLKSWGERAFGANLHVNLYFVEWHFTPYKSVRDAGTKDYYNSLEYGTGLQEGQCPYLLYRVPVEVRYGTEDSWVPGAGYRIIPSGLPDEMDGLMNIITDETDADGKATVYLPYQQDTRYILVASNEYNDAGYGVQPHDMRRGGNEKVIIYVKNLDQFSFQVRKYWEIDGDEQDKPENPPLFVVQELNQDTGAWEICTLGDGSPAVIRLNYSSKTWQGAISGLPMWLGTGAVRTIRQYRVRELGGSAERVSGESNAAYIDRLKGLIVYDRNDPERAGQAGDPVVSYSVPAYMSAVTGKMVPEHQTRYRVHYDTDIGYNGTVTVDVTNTAIEEIDIHKLWDGIPEAERPELVYVSLQTKPEDGWESYAESEGMAPSWQTVTDALSGPTLGLNDLIAVGILDVEVPRLKGDGFAMTDLTAENGWSTSYVVKKYENGVPMMWQAAELDEAIVQTAITQAYGFSVGSQVVLDEDYVSIPGRALPVGNGWNLTAGIVNTKEKEGFTVGGVKYWPDSALEGQVIPESIDIVVIDSDTGEEAGRVTVSGPTDPSELQMWPWSLTSESLSPTGHYEIREELPDGVAGRYSCAIYGYDLINTWVGDMSVDIRVRKLWDPLYLQYIVKEHGEGTEPIVDVPITLTALGERYSLLLTADGGFEDTLSNVELADPDDPFDPAKFSIKESVPRTLLSSLPNSSFIPVYSGPELTIEEGRRVYTFTVTNMLQFEYDLSQVYKAWDFGPYSESDVIIPSSISIELLRNGEPMGGKATTSGSWLYDYSGRLYDLATLSTYGLKQQPMMRLDPEGRPYKYSIRETLEPEDLLLTDETDPGTGGYICALSMFSGWDETGLRFMLTNRWVPGMPEDAFVTIRGTKSWKPEPWPANASLRPDLVGVYILDGNDELAAIADCKYVFDDRAWTWYAEGLPRYDENGDEIAYHIQEKHVDGYTAFYDEPTFDASSRTWTCDMENRLGYAYMDVYKSIMDGTPAPEDTFTFRMSFISGFSDSDFGAPKLKSDTLEITGEGSGRFQFLLNGEGVFLYQLEELDGGDPKYRYDTTSWVVILVVTRDSDGLPTGDIRLLKDGIVINEGETFEELLDRLPYGRSVLFRNYIQDTIFVEKKWEIDLEDKDRPDQVMVAVQKKIRSSNPERWETVATGWLKAEDGWKAEIGVPKPGESNPQYRVREMDANGGIVYAPGDADKPEEGEAGFITYPVPEYESVLMGGTVSAHDTRYQVSYGKDGDTYTVTNTAVTAVDVKKHWILLSDEEEAPDSAWVVLLYKPAADAMENAQGIPEVDLSGLEDVELPVFRPVSGGINPVDLVTELALGVSADIFGSADSLSVAIAKVSEENGWTAHFADTKYILGIPKEFKGAELGSEIIRQVIKYGAGFNLPVSYNPFDNYISIPGKAYRTFASWGLADLDASVLEKLVKAGKTLTAEDLDRIRPEDSLLSDIQLQANVINVQIDIDNPPEPDPDEDPVPLTGLKRWKGDQEENRPETLTIHVREKEKNEEGGHDEVEGSPITLNKSSFPGQDEWTWTLSGQNVDGNKEYEVSEEYPEGFENRDHYTGEVVDTEIINTWSEEEVTTVKVSGQKTWDDKENKAKKRPARITIQLLADGEAAVRPAASGSGTEPVKPVETSEEGGWKYFFTDLPRYKTVDGEKQEIKYSVKEKDIEGYTAEYADPVFDETTRNWDCDITNKLDGYGPLKIEKKWDIDILGNDRPDSIEVLVQKKTGSGDSEKWVTVELVELKEDGDWKHECYLPLKQKKEGSEDETEDIVYRVRELKGDGGILKMLQDKVNEYAGQGKEKFDEWIGDIKTNAKDLFDSLPDSLKDAANESFDKLAQELDAKESQVYKKLLEKLQFYSAEKRIVYDKDDKDKPKKKDDDDKEPETNVVTFKVKEKTSVTGDQEDAHETKYKVKYSKKDGEEGEGATYFIGNQAILEIDVVKRWLMLGDADDEDKPDSVWLVLLFKLDEDMVEKAGDIGSAANVDVSGLTDIEIPVFNLFDNALFTSGLISGGMNPITIISELVAGVDIDVFNLGDKLLKIAVAKVDEDDDWTAHFVTSKYMFGFPVEFKGAELSSEILRQLVKYLLHVDLPVSFTPFGNYISIPGKAYGNLLDVNQVSDLFDLDDSSIAGKLAGEVLDLVLDKLNDLIKEIAPDGLPIGLDDWEQVANVINVKLDIDLPETVSGRKIWMNDQEENRPEYLTIQVKQGDEIVFTEQISADNDWSWSFEPEKEEDEDDSDEEDDEGGDSGDSDEDYTVEEIWPDDYPEEKIARYTLSTSGYDLINTWDGVTVAGRKIWEDDNDRDRLRPEKITIRLLADGEPVTREVQKTNEETGETTTEIKEVTVETSAQGDWKYVFPNLPKQKEGEDGQKTDIVYSVEETEVPEGYTVSGGTQEDDWDLTNTHEPETRDDITVEKVWDDDDDRDGLRPEEISVVLLANGAAPEDQDLAEPVKLNEENGWQHTYTNLYKYDNGEEIEYTVDETEVPEGYEKTVEDFTITNKHEPQRMDVTVKKVWDDTDDTDGLRPDSVKIMLLANGAAPEDLSEENQAEPVDIGEAENWEYTYTGMLKYHQGEEIEYTADEEDVPEGYEKEIDGLTVINSHAYEKVTIHGKKVWDDADDQDGIRPDEITVILLANGEKAEETTVSATPENPEEEAWTFTFEDMPKNQNGEPIAYTVSEVPVPGYQATVNGDMENGFTITNAHIPDTVSVSGEKIWNDANDQDGKRPKEIMVYLFFKGALFDNRSVSAVSGWKYSFSNIPKNWEGQAADWSIQEQNVPEDYEVAYSDVIETSEDNYTINIINTYVPETIDVTVSKTWDDGGNRDGIRPPSIKVYLYADGAKVEGKEAVLNEDNDWEHTFTDMPKYAAGKEIVYSAYEDPVPGYTMTISGTRIINTHMPETVTISGEKFWDDEDDQDAIRPESITVTLSADGMDPLRQTVTPDEEGRWRYTFYQVPVYNHGEKLSWTIAEDPIPEGYHMVISGWNITNVHVPEKTEIQGKKIWDDADDRDGIRPDEITVILLANGEKTDEITVQATPADPNAEEEWSFSFKNLPKNRNGEPIAYTVNEVPMPGYQATVNGDMENGFTITNAHIPDTVSVSGEKIWNDANDQDGKRPKEIMVYLFFKGALFDNRSVSAVSGWKYSFSNIPKNWEGQAADWSIQEQNVPEDYEVAYSDVIETSEDNYTINIINTYVPETIDVTVSKTWDDGGNRDGIRPPSIKVYLYADGAKVEGKEAVLNEDNDWEHTFTDMPKYAAGKEIVYSAYEDPVPGYTMTISGTRIINTHMPETVTISGEKFWDDEDDQDAIRPESITVTLSADGMDPLRQTVTPDEEGRWRYTFYQVPVYNHGEKLSWTIAEDPIPEGYHMVISGWNITNVHVPEKTEIQGKKIWDDQDDRDGFRPNEITVILRADGKEVKRIPVTAADGWQYRFQDLYLLKNGREIVYTVDEEPVEGYQKEINGYDITNTLQLAKYTVERYYQVMGAYPGTPNTVEERSGLIGSTVKMTDADKAAGRERYAIDETVSNTLTGTVKEDGSLVLRIYFRPYYVITYDPNGGTLAGSSDPVDSIHHYGDVITIREKAKRPGYVFEYWMGSSYKPGQKYTVTGDHTFIAVWDEGRTFRFTFTKKWLGGHENSIEWTLYNPDGTQAHKKFNKKITSETEWHYEAWFMNGADYYIIEDVPAGYKVRYENVGEHADVKDRCYNGGTIINYKVPRTGDSTHPEMGIAGILLGLTGISIVLYRRKRRKAH